MAALGPCRNPILPTSSLMLARTEGTEGTEGDTRTTCDGSSRPDPFQVDPVQDMPPCSNTSNRSIYPIPTPPSWPPAGLCFQCLTRCRALHMHMLLAAAAAAIAREVSTNDPRAEQSNQRSAAAEAAARCFFRVASSISKYQKVQYMGKAKQKQRAKEAPHPARMPRFPLCSCPACRTICPHLPMVPVHGVKILIPINLVAKKNRQIVLATSAGAAGCRLGCTRGLDYPVASSALASRVQQQQLKKGVSQKVRQSRLCTATPLYSLAFATCTTSCVYDSTTASRTTLRLHSARLEQRSSTQERRKKKTDHHHHHCGNPNASSSLPCRNVAPREREIAGA